MSTFRFQVALDPAWTIIGLLSSALFLAACGGTVQTDAGDGAREAEVAEFPTGVDDSRVGCRFGPSFPIAVLDELPPLVEVVAPEVAAAIAPFLASDEGQFWPQEGWRLLEIVPDELAQLVNPGTAEAPHLAFMAAEWTNDGWSWGGSSIPNDCELFYEPRLGAANLMEWELDPSGPPLEPDSTSVSVIATESACASGQPVDDRVRDPIVTTTDDYVRVVLSADPPGGESQNCPGNPSAKITVDLPEPLGERQLVDARFTGLGDLSQILADQLGGPVEISLATYRQGSIDTMAELVGTIEQEPPCLYVADSTGRRYLLIVPERTSSWKQGQESLTLLGTQFSNGAHVSVGGTGSEDRPDGVDLVQTNIVTPPEATCDLTNVWFANGIEALDS